MSESTEPEHVRADEWITDPIAVSLRASIDDGKTAYRDLEKVDRRSYFETKTLDIWSDRDRPRRLQRAYRPSRGLPADLLDPYHPDADPNERLTLRLVCTRPVVSSDEIAWHDDLNFPGHRQINYLPFVPAAIDDLWLQWDLPREWTWLRLNAREVGNYHRKTEFDFDMHPPKAKRMAIAINFPFVLRPAKQEEFLSESKGGKGAGRRTARSQYNPWRDDPFVWSFAMSHSLQDGKTRALLDGLTDYAFGDLSQRILKADSHWYLHPLHVPIILLDVVFFHAAWEINQLCVDVARFEDLSRDARVSSLDRYDAITTQIRYLRRAFGFLLRLTKFLLDTLEFLDNKVFVTGRSGRDPANTYEAYLMETNPRMEEKLKNTQGLIENNIETSDYLQARAKDALDFINGTISLRDQAASQDDADSNKTMSLLQMTFLPATFVAAIMSINVFDFTQDPPAVYPSFWIFWLVSGVLTAAVLTLFFGVRFFKKSREQSKEDKARKEEEQDRLDNVRPPSGSVGYESEKSGPERRGSSRRHRKRNSRPAPEAAED